MRCASAPTRRSASCTGCTSADPLVPAVHAGSLEAGALRGPQLLCAARARRQGAAPAAQGAHLLTRWCLPCTQDFVKLARWEDRGYYALRERADKAQRQLHKLARRAAAALAQPCAAVLAAASAAMGLSDLAVPELPAPEAGAALRKLPKKRRAAAAASAEPDWVAQVGWPCLLSRSERAHTARL